jgi:hypothetical protein
MLATALGEQMKQFFGEYGRALDVAGDVRGAQLRRPTAPLGIERFGPSVASSRRASSGEQRDGRRCERRYLGDGDIPCDYNWVESQIRPIAMTCS